MKRFNILLFLIVCITLSSAQNNVSTLSLNHIEETYIQQGLSVVNDTTISLNYTSPISGLSVSGIATLNHSSNSLVRITLEDEYHTEALVYEVYPLLADSSVITFNNVAFETAILDNVIAKSLHIKIVNATLQLNDIHVSTQAVSTAAFSSRQSQVLEAQSSYVIDKLNDNLEKRNLPWRAGETSISRLTYEEKKGLFGGDVPNLGGFEYYKGGIFVMPDYWENHENITPQPLAMNTNEESTEDPYVREWDWRNRHGKNWMTSVKDQGYCGSCWAFAAVGTLEAYINLYYNQQLNLDLSEQELVSCAPVMYSENGILKTRLGEGCIGGNFYSAYLYIKENGLVSEDDFKYVSIGGDNGDCADKSTSPKEQIKFNDYTILPTHLVGDSALKKALFRSPHEINIKNWHHALVVAGYKNIQAGDSLYIKLPEREEWFKIQEDNPLVGSTAWLLKNSYGTDWGENGYAYVVAQWDSIEVNCIEKEIESLNYTNNNIVVEDKDNDGYYVWGIGEKPEWILEDADGDDTNEYYGPINEYGHLQKINLTSNQPYVIYTNYEYSTGHINLHLRIVNGGILTIRENTAITMHPDATITVESGGEIIIDGGIINKANITLKEGGKLTLQNGGQINLKSNDSFNAELGSILNINSGVINNMK